MEMGQTGRGSHRLILLQSDGPAVGPYPRSITELSMCPLADPLSSSGLSRISLMPEKQTRQSQIRPVGLAMITRCQSADSRVFQLAQTEVRNQPRPEYNIVRPAIDLHNHSGLTSFRTEPTAATTAFKSALMHLDCKPQFVPARLVKVSPVTSPQPLHPPLQAKNNQVCNNSWARPLKYNVSVVSKERPSYRIQIKQPQQQQVKEIKLQAPCIGHTEYPREPKPKKDLHFNLQFSCAVRPACRMQNVISHTVYPSRTNKALRIMAQTVLPSRRQRSFDSLQTVAQPRVVGKRVLQIGRQLDTTVHGVRMNQQQGFLGRASQQYMLQTQNSTPQQRQLMPLTSRLMVLSTQKGHSGGISRQIQKFQIKQKCAPVVGLQAGSRGVPRRKKLFSQKHRSSNLT